MSVYDGTLVGTSLRRRISLLAPEGGAPWDEGTELDTGLLVDVANTVIVTGEGITLVAVVTDLMVSVKVSVTGATDVVEVPATLTTS